MQLEMLASIVVVAWGGDGPMAGHRLQRQCPHVASRLPEKQRMDRRRPARSRWLSSAVTIACRSSLTLGSAALIVIAEPLFSRDKVGEFPLRFTMGKGEHVLYL